MSRCFVLPAMVALVLASACAGGATPSTTPATAPASPSGPAPTASPAGAIPTPSAGTLAIAARYNVPQRVGNYVLVQAQVSPAGTDPIFRYRGGDSTINISAFIYDVSPTARQQSNDPQAWVTREGEGFAQVVSIQRQRGIYTAVRMISAQPDSLMVAGRRIAAYTSVAGVTMRGRQLVELQSLFYVAPRMLKVRATVPEESWAGSDLPRFARDLATTLGGGSPSGGGGGEAR